MALALERLTFLRWCDMVCKKANASSLLIGAAMFIAGCGGGQPVSVTTHQPAHAAALPSPDNSLCVESSLATLKSAQTQADFDRAVSQIKNTSGPSFQWPLLWDGLSKVDEIKKFNLEKLFELHEVSCRPEDFSSFSVFAINQSTGRVNLFFPKRKCQVQLPDALKIKFIRKFMEDLEKNPEAASFEIGNFITSEYSASNANNQADWPSVLKTPTNREWVQILDSITKAGKYELATGLVELLSRVNGAADPSLGRHIVLPIINNTQIYARSVADMSLPRILRILEATSESVFNGGKGTIPVQTKKIAGFIERLLDSFATELQPSRELKTDEIMTREHWKHVWKSFSSMRATVLKFEHRLDATILLSWLERLHRLMEADLRRNTDAALYFLSNDIPRSPDQSWLLFRLLPSEFRPRIDLSVFSSDQVGTSDAVVLKRLHAHLASEPLLRENALKQYCSLLAGIGIKPAQIPFASFTENPVNTLQSRGCVRVTGKAAKQRIDLDTAIMPFDLVLSLPPADFAINARVFDGSFLDFSYEPEAHATASSDDRDANIVPVLWCINAVEPSRLIKKGKHCFATHFPVKYSVPGGTGNDIKIDGYRAGTLRLHTAQSAGSFAPSVLALEAGGKGASSIIDFDGYGSWLSLTNARIADMTKKYTFHKNAVAPYIRLALDIAERNPDNENQKQIYILSEYIDVLNQSERKMLDRACRAWRSRDECLKKDIGPRLGAYVLNRSDEEMSKDRPFDIQQPSFEIPAAPAGTRKTAVTMTGFEERK